MIYQDLRLKYQDIFLRLERKASRIASLRLLVALLVLFSFYQLTQTGYFLWLIIALVGTAVFAYLVRVYQSLSREQRIVEGLVAVNHNEIQFLEQNEGPFDPGTELQPETHFYAYDLDILGKNSLFQYLNRTATWPGKTALANMLLHSLTNPDAILARQQAVRELAPKLDWRQRLLAVAALKKDDARATTNLLRWADQPAIPVPLFFKILAWVLPAALFGSLIVGMATGNSTWAQIASGIFAVNLSVLGLFFKKIQGEIAAFDEVHVQLRQYGLLVENMENEPFESPLLRDIVAQLHTNTSKASTEILYLSNLFNRLDSIANLMVVLLFDGLFLFHVHQLDTLQRWKKRFAHHIPQWLNAIGQMEALSSLANFAHNNPDFAYPTLNAQHRIYFEELGHPLLRREKRVCNTVEFDQPRFVVLTGSNMSGKSTFLRSLGVNLVLAGTGAPVCARVAQVHPLPLLVSMRLNDSLSDSESYFFAEVKRLSEIVDFATRQRTFVLLDEILRGTNSDDKRMGTVGVLKKMVELQAIGAIATHDIEVCNTTLEHPDSLMNKCFEVNIVNNEALSFDYVLRDGVCQNKSASFLMRKMKIIA